MATVYPRSPRSALLGWAASHAEKWAADPQAVGLTSQRTAQYSELVEQARQAGLAQFEAQSAAAAATAHYSNLAAQLERATGSMVQSIRAFAAVAPDQDAVLNTAWVQSVRPDRGPEELTPTQPSQPTGRLLAGGELELRWTCTQPRGTDGAVYTVYRKLPGEGAFRFIGTAGGSGRNGKRLIDRTLPAGVAWAEYTVQSHRGSREGPTSPIGHVRFGAVQWPPGAADEAANRRAA